MATGEVLGNHLWLGRQLTQQSACCVCLKACVQSPEPMQNQLGVVVRAVTPGCGVRAITLALGRQRQAESSLGVCSKPIEDPGKQQGGGTRRMGSEVDL